MIPRRMIGFGFALFLMMVILAVIYAQFVAAPNTHDMTNLSLPEQEKLVPKESASQASSEPVTPDAAVDDLIDEALSDRDDLSAYEDDEMADIEEGNASINSLNTVYDENEVQ